MDRHIMSPRLYDTIFKDPTTYQFKQESSMATKREELEAKAKDLGLQWQPDTTDEDLQQLIDDFDDDQEEETLKGSMRYYRTKLPGLEVIVGDPDPTKGEVAHKTVAFVPYWEQTVGVEGKFKVGYLATDEASAQEKLKGDPNVEAISKKAYEEATTVKHDKDGNQTAAFRAPY